MLQAHLDYINLFPCDRGFTTGERIFTFPYLLYVHRGKGIFKIGSQALTGTMGDLFYCPAGTGNTIIADPADPFLLTGIDFMLTGQPTANRQPPDDLLAPVRPQLNILANTFLVSLINQMVSEFRLGRIYAREICSALLTAMLVELIRLGQTDIAEKDKIQTALLDYLRNCSGKTVDHAEMSRAFSYHKSSVNRIMTAATGLSLREYQIAARIKMAAELLAYSSRPLSEIAALCGYGSPIFFSRQFREKTGQTPRAYRQARQHPGRP